MNTNSSQTDLRPGFILIAIALLLLAGCAGERESAPFKDGDYLVYHDILNKRKAVADVVFKVSTAGSDLRVQEVERVMVGGSVHSEKDQVAHDIDSSGVILKSEHDLRVGKQLYLWLPSRLRRPGASFDTSGRGPEEVNSERWNSRDVLVVVAKIGSVALTHYYDQASGLLVRWTVGDVSDYRLVDTNMRVETVGN
jgi:hypothetical protein